jgi:hypothetical protein
MLFWPAVHGLAVLVMAGALKNGDDAAFEQMFRMLIPALGVDQG